MEGRYSYIGCLDDYTCINIYYNVSNDNEMIMEAKMIIHTYINIYYNVRDDHEMIM